jgi:fructokinase
MCVLSPERIIVGGGAAGRDGLLRLVQREVSSLMNGYLDSKVVRERISEYITAPALGARAGVLGAIALAELV